jgi:hypothetical protein
MLHFWLRLLPLFAVATIACSPASDSTPSQSQSSTPWPSIQPEEQPSSRPGSRGRNVRFTSQGIQIDGRYRILRGGTVQWFRLPESTWEDRLRRYKEMGFNALDIYIAWNQIEPREGEFNFEQPNLRRFLELARQYDLFVVVRPGPYITNEMDGGGLPAWLTRRSGKRSYEADAEVHLRSHDPDFIEPVRRYLTALNEVLKPYFADRGGPIVLYVVENEYNWFERSFQADRLFWLDRMLERPIQQQLPTAPYFTALRDIVRDSGVTVPIVTCPGDGRISAMGDVPGITPFPNIYEWANPGQPEEIAYDLLTDMRDPKYGGIYDNQPSGSMELNRSTQELRRLVMGGLDALFVFNVVGMIQQGYLNSLTLAARAGDQPPHWGPPDEKAPDWLGTILEFDRADRIFSGFVSPDMGYFGNVIDYDGAISPSGVLRDLYFQFRRDNFFFNTVEEQLGASGLPQRSGNFAGSNPDLWVRGSDLGAREKEGKVRYWHESPDGTSFISLLNQTGKVQKVQRADIRFRGLEFPRFTTMTIPTADEPKLSYAQILLHNYPVGSLGRMVYSTSELLTQRPFNGEQLLVLYGSPGSEGELQLHIPDWKLVSKSDDLRVREANPGSLSLSYPHRHGATALIENARGERLRILISHLGEVGHFWFLKRGNEDILVTGVDFIESLPESGELRYEADERSREILILSNAAVHVRGHETLSAFDPLSGLSRYRRLSATVPPTLPPLQSGVKKGDMAEALPETSTQGWIQWEGEPHALEHLDIFKGRAWYRTEFDIPDLKAVNGRDRLYIQSASDIVGIYLNGQYVSTVAPVGTEIDNLGPGSYRFASILPYLKVGRNVLAFRTEVWGHGSFMFGKGSVLGTKARLPALPYDGLKGLYGRADIAGIPLTRWQLRNDLTGERLDYADPGFDDSSWTPTSLTGELQKGEIRWVRTRFATDDLPSSDAWSAPVILKVQGRRSKATLYLNGQMIGRWLSDADWLKRGSWAQPQRGMWVPLSPDHFPIPREMLYTDGRENVITAVFEDCSHSSEAPGVIERFALDYNQEDLRWTEQGRSRGPGIRQKFDFEWGF